MHRVCLCTVQKHAVRAYFSFLWLKNNYINYAHSRKTTNHINRISVTINMLSIWKLCFYCHFACDVYIGAEMGAETCRVQIKLNYMACTCTVQSNERKVCTVHKHISLDSFHMNLCAAAASNAANTDSDRFSMELYGKRSNNQENTLRYRVHKQFLNFVSRF